MNEGPPITFLWPDDDTQIYSGRPKDQFDAQPNEQLVAKRECGDGCCILIYENTDLLSKLTALVKKKVFVQPLFTPDPERYEGYPELQQGGYWLRTNQRLVIRQGERVFQAFPLISPVLPGTPGANTVR